MNCWKSYNLSKDVGSMRLVILSLFGVVCFFVLFNLAFTDIFGPLKIENFNILVVLCCLLLIYPFHKLMHCIPMWLFGKKVRLAFELGHSVPRLFCDIKGTIPKRLYMVVVLFPLLFITASLCVLTIYYPIGIHYYSITGSINFGISMADLLYFSKLVSAPSDAIIEDDRDGCHILIRQYL